MKMQKNLPDVNEAADSAGKAAASQKSGPMHEILSWIEVIVIAVVLALVITQFIIINATVPSGSMENTIHPGDRLIGLRLTYKFSDPQRGDIVVFRYPVDAAQGKKTNYIKRIIGLPGETVEIKDAKIIITDADGNQETLDEPYLKETWTVRNDGYTFHVPEGCYLMLGDNRNNSSDARYWAQKALENIPGISDEEAESLQYVKRSQILGKAYFRYWPLNHISTLYKNTVSYE